MAPIYLDARNITDRPAGVARYARSLIKELVHQAPHHQFIALRHRSNTVPLLPEATNLREVFLECPIDGAKNFFLGHRALSAAFSQNGAPHLFHSLFHLLPLQTRRVLGDIPVVTTLHDFVWIDHPDVSQPTFFKARTIQTFAKQAIPTALRLSDRVIVISEPTRQRARAYIDDKKMVLISHGVETSFFEPPKPLEGDFAELITDKKPYIVAIGNDKKYKNLHLLIDAFTIAAEQGLKARLVLIGDCQGLNEQIVHTGQSEWITLTDNVDDETLHGLLGHAKAFVFPSKVEGFGLPVLEAMAMGVPTLIARREPMLSIADEAALYFDPDNAPALANLLERLLTDQALARRYSARGRARARQFCWSKTAKETLALYESLLEKP